jgi:hypothetical protein
VIFFVAASSLGYALTDLAGINVLRYFPAIRMLATESIAGQIEAGLSGRLLVGMLFGCIAVAIYFLSLPLIQRFDLLHTTHATVAMTASFWLSVALIVVQEWRRWVVPEGSPGLFNDEFWMLFVALIIFLFGLLFNAGFEHRIARLVKREHDAPTEQEDERHG